MAFDRAQYRVFDITLIRRRSPRGHVLAEAIEDVLTRYDRGDKFDNLDSPIASMCH